MNNAKEKQMQIEVKKSDFLVVAFALIIAGGLMYQGITVLIFAQDVVSQVDFR